MTWRPVPQPPCEPGCTCHVPTETPLQVIPEGTPLRECGVTGCTSCDEVYAFWDHDPDPVPGGGDRLPPRPIDAYQEASNELHRGKTP